MQSVKEKFKDIFGIAFDDFMLLDLPDTTNDANGTTHNPEKYMFYNDPFCGVFDCLVDGEPRYREFATLLDRLTNNKSFGCLFKAEAALCRFLQIKYSLGVRTRLAYRAKEIEWMKRIIEDYKIAEILLNDFYRKHQERWYRDNKPFGFDVQEIRIGGLKLRMQSCRERLEKFVKNPKTKIPELDEDILPAYEGYINFNKWSSTATVNVISHI